MQVKIKSVTIELELVDKSVEDLDHATTLIYTGKQWIMNGPVFPRFLQLMNEIIAGNKK